MNATRATHHREQLLATHCASNLADSRCREALALLLKEGLSSKLISFCCHNGLKRFVVEPGEQVGLESSSHATPLQPLPHLLYTLPASSLLDYCSEPACLHIEAQPSDKRLFTDVPLLYPTLQIGPHASVRTCNPLSTPKAWAAIKSPLITSNAFGVCLNSYAVRHLAFYSDQSIRAICYGQARSFLLKGAQ